MVDLDRRRPTINDFQTFPFTRRHYEFSKYCINQSKPLSCPGRTGKSDCIECAKYNRGYFYQFLEFFGIINTPDFGRGAEEKGESREDRYTSTSDHVS